MGERNGYDCRFRSIVSTTGAYFPESSLKSIKTAADEMGVAFNVVDEDRHQYKDEVTVKVQVGKGGDLSDYWRRVEELKKKERDQQ